MNSGRLILHEDEHLLVIRKPAGINTHSASPYAGEGIYEWLKRREPRWSELAILQRLDKETSGVLVFSKTRRGNVSLNKQFSRRRLEKEYLLLTDRRPRENVWKAQSRIRKGDGRFESHTVGEDGLEAETDFAVVTEGNGRWLVRAEPRTGRTHQIRLHARDSGIPILGDVLYGGSPFRRLCLHARALRLRHPASNEKIEFVAEPEFEVASGLALRESLIDPSSTNAYRRIHGAADGCAGWFVDRLGDYLLVSSDDRAMEGFVPTGAVDGRADALRSALSREVPAWVDEVAAESQSRGVYLRKLCRTVRASEPDQLSPVCIRGTAAVGPFEVVENGLRYELSFEEGYSVGLFLDQRDNRRRLIANWIGPEFPVREAGLEGAEVLNLFSYTCGFSVAAARAGARTTSIDLSKKYLDWGRRNMERNGMDSGHDFICGDTFDWLRRLAKKNRRYSVVIADPPTFSKSKERGVFRAESDFGELVVACLGVLESGGVMLLSTNAARWEPELWLGEVRRALAGSGRMVERELFVPQPPDFPTCREEAGYLKTLWIRVR